MVFGLRESVFRAKEVVIESLDNHEIPLILIHRVFNCFFAEVVGVFLAHPGAFRFIPLPILAEVETRIAVAVVDGAQFLPLCDGEKIRLTMLRRVRE